MSLHNDTHTNNNNNKCKMMQEEEMKMPFSSAEKESKKNTTDDKKGDKDKYEMYLDICIKLGMTPQPPVYNLCGEREERGIIQVGVR